MLLSIAILGTLVAGLTVVALVRGGATLAWAGAQEGLQLLLSVAPQLLLGFLLAGLVTVLVPSEVIGRVVGEESGLTGVVIATAAGIITPGGPFLQFPLVAALARAGAGVGPMAAYLTAWSLLGVNRALVWEIPVLGAPFTATRWLVSLAVPIVIGMAIPLVLRSAR